MVPRPEGPVSPAALSDADSAPGEARDPVRFAVQLALAIYLSPVVLIVCLIGGTSMVVGEVSRALRHVGRHPLGRSVAGPRLAGRGHAKAVTGLTRLVRRPDVTR